MPLLSRRATAALDARVMRGHNDAVVARLSGMHPGAFLSPQISACAMTRRSSFAQTNHEA